MEGLNHKNPQVKSESLNWIIRSLRKIKKAPTKADFVPLFEPLLKVYNNIVILF